MRLIKQWVQCAAQEYSTLDFEPVGEISQIVDVDWGMGMAVITWALPSERTSRTVFDSATA